MDGVVRGEVDAVFVDGGAAQVCVVEAEDVVKLQQEVDVLGLPFRWAVDVEEGAGALAALEAFLGRHWRCWRLWRGCLDRGDGVERLLCGQPRGLWLQDLREGAKDGSAWEGGRCG